MPLLFSYGTLQQHDVQQATFGRQLSGRSDALTGFETAMQAIADAAVRATSGSALHPIVRWTGRDEDRVPGTVFEISEQDLAQADAYEVSAYLRIEARLASGLRAWVYVDARHAGQGLSSR